jgi:hypothetical protein
LIPASKPKSIPIHKTPTPASTKTESESSRSSRTSADFPRPRGDERTSKLPGTEAPRSLQSAPAKVARNEPVPERPRTEAATANAQRSRSPSTATELSKIDPERLKRPGRTYVPTTTNLIPIARSRIGPNRRSNPAAIEHFRRNSLAGGKKKQKRRAKPIRSWTHCANFDDEPRIRFERAHRTRRKNPRTTPAAQARGMTEIVTIAWFRQVRRFRAF